MKETLEGKFHPMHADPKSLRAATRVIFLMPFWLIFALVLGQLAYITGAWIGVTLFGR